ncbi:MAG: MBL fold metallo-hydrolase [Acidobacteriota bacterium]
MGDQTPVIEGTLGIHILSSTMGESIIVTLPDKSWFVIDAFSGARVKASGPNRPHAVLSFLKRFGLNAVDCNFVLLTHLHEDHYEGVPFLLKQLRELHPTLPLARHGNYRETGVLKVLEKHYKAEYLVSSKVKHIGIRADEVAKLFANDCIDLGQWELLHSHSETQCKVFTVAPGENIVNRFYNPKAFRSDLDQEAPKEVLEIVKSQNKIINDMSVAVCVQFGETCVLLPGDCEKEAWRAIAEKPLPNRTIASVVDPLGAVNFMKAPHHASARAWNSYLESLYRPCDVTVATHHEKGQNQLPNPEGLALIRRTGTGVAIPDRSLLAPELQEQADDLPRFTRIPVPHGRRGSELEAEKLRAGLDGSIRSEPQDEIAWVSLSFHDDGSSSGRWYGGSQAAFLPAFAARPQAASGRA